jgi:hypothetical protein
MPPSLPRPPQRQYELDALRGLMLMLMTVTHLPTRLSSPLGQPFGYVSAAEGFVLLSAYMAGLVYGRVALAKGIDAMRLAFWRRARKVYFAHAAMLFFLFTVIAGVGVTVDQPAVENLMSFYLAEPWRALLASLVLLYRPPLLDILPMYVLFMLTSPVALAWGARRGWTGILTGSISLWVLSQFGLGEWLFAHTVTAAGGHLPFNEAGSFSTFSWQLLWVVGLWMGASRSGARVVPFVFPRWALWLALLLGALALVWRHWVGQVPFEATSEWRVAVNLMFDKWQLGPLRLLNLTMLVILTIHFGPAVANFWERHERAFGRNVLVTLGSASLPVFCAQLLLVLLVLTVWGDSATARSVWGDITLLAACFGLLYLVADMTLWIERTGARLSPPFP